MLETIAKLSFTIAAFIFNVTLCVLVTFSSADDRHKNHTFRNFTYVVLIGNLITTCDILFRRSVVVPIPYPARLAFYVLAFLSNVALTYFFAIYAETFFEKTARRAFFSKINLFLLIGLFLLAVVCFLITLPKIGDDKYSYLLPTVPKYILAYFSEIYYLLYAMILFIVNGKAINRRARITAAWAFGVTIGTIVFEVFNPTEIYFNYFGAILGLYIFYMGVETPDYKNLMAAMKELEKEKLRADEANRSKSDFLANMSHEIRTPINAVIGMNEMILREASDDKIIDYSHNIESAGKSLLSIINDILDFSKIEAGRMEINTVPYSFSSLINDVEVMISVKAKEKNLDFKVTVDESMPNGLFGDDIRIKQVLVNILNNAVKYTEKGYVNIDVSYEKNGGECTVFFTIKDSGIGIKEEDIPKLFEKFDRFDMNKNKTIEGTGLGLAIVKSLLSMMNGTIDVESEYGKGSTFLLRIPQKINSDESISDYKKQYVTRSADGGYKELFRAPDAEILVIDDTIVNLTVAKALLKKTLIKVDTAKNAAEALEMTKKKHYDMILLDNRMPGMDGTEALPIIRSQEDGLNHKTPVVCLTADAVSGAKQRYLDEGFTDYLSKPIESASLERILLKYLPDEKIEKNR